MMGLFAKDIESLSPEKRQLLALLLKEKGLQNVSAWPIRPAKWDTHSAPLSFAQQRLWFLDQLKYFTAAYNLPAAVRLVGLLDVSALEKSLNEVIRRHETLRTTFRTVAGQGEQVVASALTITLPEINLEGLPEAEREIQVQQLAQEGAQQSFDLARGPLVRATLLRLQETDHVLLLTMHHIISDAWSINIVLREIGALYQAFTSGKVSPLPELPIQYRDFAIWQRAWLEGETLSNQLAYWQEQLKGIPQVLELPTDRPRPAVQTFRGAVQNFILPVEVAEELKQLSQQTGATLFMTLLAAFKILLSRYTGQEDIVVGSPIANRNRDEIEGLIGFFVNTLVLRSNLGGRPSFQELLGRVREMTLAAYAHQDLPFEKLVEKLQPERSVSHTPLFQVMFILQNAPMPVVTLPGLSISPLEVEHTTAKFDLTLAMQERGPELRGAFEYNADLFDAATIRRMAEHFQTLLKGIVADPHQPLTHLPLLAEEERRQLLVEWNQTRADYPQDKCLHELFEAQASQTPEAVALIFEGKQLTYQELNRRANQVAHYLRGVGIGPDTLVAISLERSIEMVVAVLGVLKAGGAYVPLDPAYPWERLALMLEDSQASVLLTQERVAANLPILPELRVIYLDAGWETIAKEPKTNLAKVTVADNLAYVIYTSGSTGRPKGVQIPHRSVVNFLEAMRRQPGLTPQDVLLAVTTLAFDIAVLELFLPLVSGARLEVASQAILADGVQLAAKLNASQATLMQATPATWQMLVASGWPGRPELKILCGGEALPRELANQLLARGREVWNLYGPTETTIWSANQRVTEGEDSVAVGRPIANTHIHLLDANLQPVPIGVPGELYIGGVGLARGYLHRPELTAEKFIPNPFGTTANNQPPSAEPPLGTAAGEFLGGRLYKTGDLARYRPDGSIEFLGRVDHQVKLRGFRIELGEIEAALSQHPAVQEAVVIARTEPSQDHSAGYRADKRLVAYIVPASAAAAPSVSELQHFLKKKLPDYMLPSTWVTLEQLPLTPNGKVDRRALPAPQGARPTLETTYIRPQTEMEQTIAVVWQEVLQLDKVGVHDTFFDLGGHSLLLVQVQNKLHQILGRDIAIVDLFQYPTVSDLAGYLSQQSPPSSLQESQSWAGKHKELLKQQRKFRDRRQAAKA